jgi:hypothetical protein
MNSTLAPKAARVRIMADILTGLTKAPGADRNLWVETGRQRPSFQRDGNDVIVRMTDGFVTTRDLWLVTLSDDSPTVTVTHNGDTVTFSDPMDALVHMHGQMIRTNTGE